MDTDLILFAKKAEDMLNNGKSAEALDVCLAGIESYPEYPMGYLMLSQCLFELSDLKGAFTSVKKGLTIYPDYKPLVKYLVLLEESVIIQEISNEFEQESGANEELKNEEIQIERNGNYETSPAQPPQTSFLKLVSNFESDEQKGPALTSENPAILPGLTYAPLRATRSANLDSPISQSINFPEFYNPYKAQEKIENTNDENERDYFTTETMASILEAQSAWKEAIESYKILAKLHPDQADRFNEKIIYLTQQMQSK